MLIEYNKNKIDAHYEKLKQLNKDYPTKYSATIVATSNDPASAVYVNSKAKKCKEMDIQCNIKRFDIDETKDNFFLPSKILSYLKNLSHTEKVIMQLPLHPVLQKFEDDILSAIKPQQDIDGFNQKISEDLLTQDRQAHALPCTPAGILLMLRDYRIYNLNNELQPYAGYNVVIIGRSKIVGRPMAYLFTALGATVTVCHSHTKKLSSITRQADIIVVAVGKPHFLKASMVKKEAVIIDVGINKLPDGKLAGDVLLDDEMQQKAGFVSPVPGGVGRYTVFAFLANIYDFSLMYRLIMPDLHKDA